MLKERRIHPRVLFKGRVDSSEDLQAEALDLSLSGIRILCDKELQEGTVLFLMVSLNCKGIIKVIGRVAWKNNHECKYQCGIEFFSLSKYEQNKIQEFIFQRYIGSFQMVSLQSDPENNIFRSRALTILAYSFGLI